MTYDPKFPYRINGQQVNADDVGVAYPMSEGDDALEVICDTKGVILEINGEPVRLHPSDLKTIYLRRLYHERATSD